MPSAIGGNRKRLRVCYFASYRSVHSQRLFDYFSGRGHEIYVFCEKKMGFFPWKREQRTDGGEEGSWCLVENTGKVTGKGKRKTVMFRGISVPNIGYDLIVSSMKNNFKALPTFLKDILRKVYFRRRRGRIKKEIALVKPDIVHALYIVQNATDVLLSDFRTSVLTIWGNDIRDDHLRSSYQLALQRRSIQHASAVTAPTRDLLNLCQQKGATKDRCHLIGMPGIDICRFEEADGNLMRSHFNIPKGSEIVFSPRAMESLYRIDNIVKAFYFVKQRRPSAFLLLLDYNHDKEYLCEIDTLIQSRGLVESTVIFRDMPKPFHDMNKLYEIGSVVVSIPKSDGMPQSVFEAFASGCPVVSSDLKTYDGIIIDKESGLRVSGENVMELANAIVKILEDKGLRAKLIKNGKEIVRKRGNILVEMKKMEGLYYKLTNRG